MRVSGTLPGSMHHLKGTQVWGIRTPLKLLALADKGCIGAGQLVPYPWQRARHARGPQGGPLGLRPAAQPGRKDDRSVEDLVHPVASALLLVPGRVHHQAQSDPASPQGPRLL